jgi:adenine deaminase
VILLLVNHRQETIHDYSTMSYHRRSNVILLVPQVRAPEDEPRASFTLIQHVKIFDGVNDRQSPGQVLIENNLIKNIRANIQAPQGATVIDGGGQTLMPGRGYNY